MKRYHALDSLRATMMLLGIWLHTVAGYSHNGGWPYKDAHPTDVYDWTLGTIHVFRMPVFFLMAGFFAALLWERGRIRYVENRLRRIVAPFTLFWCAMFPVVLWLAAFSLNWNHSDGARRATHYLLHGGFWGQLQPLHLWFLEYLVFLYVIGYAVVAFAEFACRNAQAAALCFRLNGIYRAAVKSPWRTLIFAVPSGATLLLMRGPYLEDPPGFYPVSRIIIAYIVPFSFGWLLFRNRDLLDSFKRRAWACVAAATALAAFWITFMDPIERHPENWPWIVPLHCYANGVFLWLVAFGLTGLFLRYLSHESPLGRYLSDGSYWMYLMHMLVVMGYQMALAPLAWPAAVKVPIVVALSFPTLVMSYDLLVRSTWIGALLNGRRYERRYFRRRNPELEPAPDAA
jgi:glucans biosynthesis protein C